jgi:hypothetical protein
MGMLYSSLGSGAFLVGLLLQIALVVHCVRTGRHRAWILAIVFLHLLGCLIYIAVEVLPALAGSRALRETNQKLSELVDPGRGLRQEGSNYALANNIKNTHAYAEQLLRNNKYQEAIDLYLAARKGVFIDDPVLLLGLARAYFAARDFTGCIGALADLKANHPGDFTPDAQLLNAMALQYDQRIDEALQQYQPLAGKFPGPEARCRYASLLQQQGRLQEAAEQFREIDLIAKSSPAHYQRMYREWIGIARTELKQLAGKLGQ